MTLAAWCRGWGTTGAIATFLLSMGSASAIEIAGDASPGPSVSDTNGGFAAFRMGNNIYGKLDIFLDVSGPGSLVAWPTLKKAAHDYRDRVEFVFHVNMLPSNSPIAHTVSKAAYLVGTRGSEEEAEAFLDQVFRNQALLLEGGEDEIIEDWAIAPGSTFDIFNFVSGAEDPIIEEQLEHSLSTMTPPLIGMRPTAVYLDGILMTYLDDSTDAGASKTFGKYLEGFIGWKANSLLLEKHNDKLQRARRQ